MTSKPEVVLHNDDCLAVLRTLPDNSVHAVITDPPYGLSDLPAGKVAEALTRWLSGDTEYIPDGKGMMGHEWDRFVPPPAVWAECLRVLKPGGHLAVFAGTRTVDLMAMSLRLAGAEIRDQLSWINGSGMPKSLNVEKALAKQEDVDSSSWKGFGTGLKPSTEPIVLARKPLDKTVANTIRKHGTGALNIDASRVPAAGGRPRRVGDYKDTDNHTYSGRMDGSLKGGSKAEGVTTEGRWPANILLDPSAAQIMDDQRGIRTSGKAKEGGHTRNTPPGEGVYGGGKDFWSKSVDAGTLYGDSGGVSRYFNVMEPDAVGGVPSTFIYASKAPRSERPEYVHEDGERVWHSTVKPLTVMRWLCTLICPPGGTVLEPFAGSGTTVEAAVLGGFNVIGIEENDRYIPLIEQRLERVR